ncbi:hypothetical protein BaRGS_00032837 [Batillaria attramentaria]|uniref:Uncharacterized protein n=1 Tax=Batillaria attramentaria TaxID=370345 RepID=A0ABD0JML1_9CAEN
MRNQFHPMIHELLLYVVDRLPPIRNSSGCAGKITYRLGTLLTRLSQESDNEAGSTPDELITHAKTTTYAISDCDIVC